MAIIRNIVWNVTTKFFTLYLSFQLLYPYAVADITISLKHRVDKIFGIANMIS